MAKACKRPPRCPEPLEQALAWLDSRNLAGVAAVSAAWRAVAAALFADDCSRGAALAWWRQTRPSVRASASAAAAAASAAALPLVFRAPPPPRCPWPPPFEYAEAGLRGRDAVRSDRLVMRRART